MDITHYVNGSFVSEKEISFNPLDLGILRGYGVFDYAQIYQGKAFHLMDHVKRLLWAAKQMELALSIELDELVALSMTMIEKNPSINGGIRWIVTGGPSQDQLIPSENASLMILFHPFISPPKRFYTEGMKVITTNTLRLFPHLKTINYLPAIFAMKQAQRKGFDDAIYVNEKGEILEGTTSNIFFFKKGILHTSSSHEIIQGVTRNLFLELAKEHFPIDFSPIYLNQLEEVDEVFLTSSKKEGIPITQIDDLKIGNGHPGPLTTKLRKLFEEYRKDYFLKESYSIHVS